jgi:hypothetical protein
MTPTPELTADQRRGQTLFMTGMGLVMGGLIFGGGLAMVFYFLGVRMGAIASILIGLLAIVAGIWLQASGARLLRKKPT